MQIQFEDLKKYKLSLEEEITSYELWTVLLQVLSALMLCMFGYVYVTGVNPLSEYIVLDDIVRHAHSYF